MKKVLATTLISCAVFASAYFTSCNNNKSSNVTSAQDDSLKKVLARGEYLALHVTGCLDCHSSRDFTKYSGPAKPGTEGGGGFAFTDKMGLPGIIYGKNITPDAETGIGSWTDAEIIRAMTQGISKNGDTLFPLMPYISYNRMAKEDLLSIVAFIKTLKPIKNKVPARQLMVPMSAVYPAAILQPSVDGNVRPDENDKVKHGEYLAMLADCANCHSPLTPQGPDMSRRLAGGYPFDMGTFKVVSSNITSDTATGIGKWTEEAFVGKFKQYRDPKSYDYDPGKKNTIMPISFYAGMKDEDLKALFAYLQTVKPINNKVEKYPE